MGTVIVGAGHCGGRVAQGLRRAGYQKPVTLIGSEFHSPYERPPLSKSALTTDWEPSSATVLSGAQCDALAIDWKAGCTVTTINAANHLITLNNGSDISFERLVLVTGGRPIRLTVPGSDLPGIHVLRTLDQSNALAMELSARNRVVIIGGGFIGLEVAAAARARECDVTVVEARDRVLGRVVPLETAQAMARLHEQHGVDIRLNSTVTGFEGTGRVARVVLENGQTIAADTVVIGIGIHPNTELAEAAGLACHDGIVTDAFGQTSDPSIWAAGDCARSVNARYDRAIRLESWQNAELQAEILAHVLTGKPVPNDAVPWQWSDHYDHTLHTVGFPAEGTRTVTRCEGDIRIDFTYDGDTLVGAAALAPGLSASNGIRVIQTMLEVGVSPAPDTVSDPSVKLKSLLKSQMKSQPA